MKTTDEQGSRLAQGKGSQLMRSEKAFRLEGSDAPRPRRGDCLPPLVVLNVSRGEYAWNGRRAAPWRSDNVAVVGQIELTLQKSCRRSVPDRVEQAANRKVSHLPRLIVLDSNPAEQRSITVPATPERREAVLDSAQCTDDEQLIAQSSQLARCLEAHTQAKKKQCQSG